jgi:phospholipase C
MRKIALVCLLALASCNQTEEKPAKPNFKALTFPSHSEIKHVIVIVQENKSFDAYFGTWCKAPTGSNPTCTDGVKCCEMAPATEPTGDKPVLLDDAENGSHDPNHYQACMISEINGGKMDRYTQGSPVSGCSHPHNFALAEDVVQGYRDLAANNAIADRYFQPVAGGSSSNNMFFAGAHFFFTDNDVKPKAISSQYDLASDSKEYTEKMVADLLVEKGIGFRVYAGGYAEAVRADQAGKAPDPDPDCTAGTLRTYPCIYTPSDIPFAYFPTVADKPEHFADAKDIYTDLKNGNLPAFSYVKGLGFQTEHANLKTSITNGVTFVTDLEKAVAAHPYYKENTLVLITWDESGGYFDHVPPPVTSAVDNQPYGARVALIAAGKFAKKGYVSHVEMEHSSIVKFIEWNWLDGVTGQLKARDAVVNNIGSLLDPAQTGVAVPEK